MINLTIITCAFALYLYRRFKKSGLTEEDVQPYLQNLDLEKEKRTKKQWLITLISMNLISIPIVIFVLNHVFNLLGTYATMPWFAYIFIPFILITIVMTVCSLYYCTYKKQGTILLSLSIMLTVQSICNGLAILFVFPLFNSINYNAILKELHLPEIFTQIVLISLVVSAWWLYISCQLLRFNSAREKVAFLSLYGKKGKDAL